MKSILFHDNPPFEEPLQCAPGRQESTVVVRKGGRIYRFTLRDKIVVEDPYLVMVKAAAFAIQEGEPYNAKVPPRSIKDFLIKSSIVI